MMSRSIEPIKGMSLQLSEQSPKVQFVPIA